MKKEEKKKVTPKKTVKKAAKKEKEFVPKSVEDLLKKMKKGESMSVSFSASIGKKSHADMTDEEHIAAHMSGDHGMFQPMADYLAEGGNSKALEALKAAVSSDFGGDLDAFFEASLEGDEKTAELLKAVVQEAREHGAEIPKSMDDALNSRVKKPVRRFKPKAEWVKAWAEVEKMRVKIKESIGRESSLRAAFWSKVELETNEFRQMTARMDKKTNKLTHIDVYEK